MKETVLALRKAVEEAEWKDVNHSVQRDDPHVHVGFAANRGHSQLEGLSQEDQKALMRDRLETLAYQFVKNRKGTRIAIEPVSYPLETGGTRKGQAKKTPILLGYKMKVFE